MNNPILVSTNYHHQIFPLSDFIRQTSKASSSYNKKNAKTKKYSIFGIYELPQPSISIIRFDQNMLIWKHTVTPRFSEIYWQHLQNHLPEQEASPVNLKPKCTNTNELINL